MDPVYADTIETVTGQRPSRVSALHGGCVSDVFRVDLENGETVVLKTGDETTGLELEADRINFLKRHGLPMPDVLCAEERMLILTYVDNDGRIDSSAEEHAAEILAALHAHTNDLYGFDSETLTVGLVKPAPWTENWIDFFREHRVLYMARKAYEANRLPDNMLKRVDKFVDQLDQWITEPAKPSLIHGDMWHGNVLCKEGRVAGFVDPSCYYADPEIELAYSTLFGTFGRSFFMRYNEITPLRPGFFEFRRDLYNLYPLLTHVRLFGGDYVRATDQILNKFGV